MWIYFFTGRGGATPLEPAASADLIGRGGLTPFDPAPIAISTKNRGRGGVVPFEPAMTGILFFLSF